MRAMRDYESWLSDLATQSVPAGAAAAALTAAMGAALVAKTVRIALKNDHLPGADRAALQAALSQADSHRLELVDLADADERAYAAVLATQARGARRAAVEVPLRLVETCQTALALLPAARDACRPSLRPDLEIGGRLLATGLDAGLLVAEANLSQWADDLNDPALSARLATLKQGEEL